MVKEKFNNAMLAMEDYKENFNEMYNSMDKLRESEEKYQKRFHNMRLTDIFLWITINIMVINLYFTFLPASITSGPYLTTIHSIIFLGGIFFFRVEENRIFSIKLTQKNRDEIEKNKKELAEVTESLEKKLENDSRLSFLAMDYRYPNAINQMTNYIYNGRADSIKEAINLYEEELHRWRLEDMAQKNIEISQQTLKEAKDAKIAAATAAAFSMAAALNRRN